MGASSEKRGLSTLEIVGDHALRTVEEAMVPLPAFYDAENMKYPWKFKVSDCRYCFLQPEKPVTHASRPLSTLVREMVL